jgi:hypothetical protein
VIIHNEATARTDWPFPLFSKSTPGKRPHALPDGQSLLVEALA